MISLSIFNFLALTSGRSMKYKACDVAARRAPGCRTIPPPRDQLSRSTANHRNSGCVALLAAATAARAPRANTSIEQQLSRTRSSAISGSRFRPTAGITDTR